MEYWEGIKSFINWLLVPVFGAAWWSFKKHMYRVDNLEKKLLENEKTIAVMQSQLKDLREDIAEIKKGINKLVDKLL